MEVSIMTSTNIENIQNDELRTSNRIFSNSDLELEFSGINNRNSANEININNQVNNEINNQINDQNNNDNDNNNNDNNLNNINDNDINNINDIMDVLLDMMLNENIENQEINTNKILNSDLIKELVNDKFVFRKDYYNQKTDENNKLYVSWLKKIYIRIFYNNFDKKKMLIPNKRIEVPDYPILKKEIEDKIFFCLNPQCNSIIYMTNEQKDKLKKIKDLIYYEDYYKILSYSKERCPLCLKYKCIYCNKISTLLNSNCCIKQLQNACSKYYINFDDYYNLFKIMLLVPIIRSFYIACMINFEYFRALTLEDKLMQSKKNISNMIQNNIPSNIISGTYQSKFKRSSIIIISLLNIFGSICWAIPFIIFLELLFTFTMFIGWCTKNKLFKNNMNKFYLLAFIPGLRRRAHGEILYI